MTKELLGIVVMKGHHFKSMQTLALNRLVQKETLDI
jgi:hypothetical protein